MMEGRIDRRRLPDGATISLWKARDGWAIRRLDWPQPKGSAMRGTMIFANGRADFIEKYIEPLAHWHGHGWNLVSFDWRGQAGSAPPSGGPAREAFEPLIEDLAALIGDAATIRPRVAVAHSMGAHLLLRLLAERGADLDAVVLVAPMLRIRSKPLPYRFGELVASLAERLGAGARPAWKNDPRPGSPAGARQANLTGCPDRYADEGWWRETSGYSLVAPTWGWLAAAFRSTRMLGPERLRGVNVPILLIGSERDRLVDPDAIREAAEALPDAELRIYPDSGHELLREADPVRLDALARIDDFLDRRAPR